MHGPMNVKLTGLPVAVIKITSLSFTVMPIITEVCVYSYTHTHTHIPNVAVEWDIIYSLYSEGPEIKSNSLFAIFIEDFRSISQSVHTITGMFPQIKPRPLSSATFFVIHTSIVNFSFDGTQSTDKIVK